MKNFELLKAWVEGKTVQYLNLTNGRWIDISHHSVSKFAPLFIESLTYRLKPETININGYEVPRPCYERLTDGQIYYYPRLGLFEIDCFKWADDDVDNKVLSQGLVHTTREAAELHLKALLSFTKKDDAKLKNRKTK